MSRRLVATALASGVLVGAAILLITVRSSDDRPVRAGLSVAEALGGDTAGFARVTGPRPFAFPADHGAHPEYRTEWWYFTGNLETDDGTAVGYQLTLFRNAVSAIPSELDSEWATRQVWMGHLGVTDVGRGDFHSFERFARGAAGLAGAETAPLRVWLEDWRIEQIDTASRDIFPLRLVAAEGDVAIDLVLHAEKPVVLQGENGYSRKGRDPGNASHYYSFTRLATEGTVRVGGETVSVLGQSWLDREWSTSALDPGQVGWDWFALQLDDGTELMYYQLRREDGGVDRFSRGTFVAPDGSAQSIQPEEVVVDAVGSWRSPRGGSYPARWQLRIPRLELALDIVPVVADQEHDAYVRYWEGAVRVSGERADRPLRGRGYVELTGYADRPR